MMYGFVMVAEKEFESADALKEHIYGVMDGTIPDHPTNDSVITKYKTVHHDAETPRRACLQEMRTCKRRLISLKDNTSFFMNLLKGPSGEIRRGPFDFVFLFEVLTKSIILFS